MHISPVPFISENICGKPMPGLNWFVMKGARNYGKVTEEKWAVPDINRTMPIEWRNNNTLTCLYNRDFKIFYY
jgi:hypothetical protein